MFLRGSDSRKVWYCQVSRGNGGLERSSFDSGIDIFFIRDFIKWYQDGTGEETKTP